ncbi:MAG: hypothetical protein Q4E77_02030 [Conchiformibius sp.]|nr:hypothetical protein [Conchiformibius sp.]
MKTVKQSVFLSALLVLLGACAGNGGNAGGIGGLGQTVGGIGSNMLSMYVQNQCVSELQSRNEWRLVALAMSQQQQAEWENRICGCVSEEAPNHLSAADLTQLVSEQGRTQVMADVTVKTVSACFQRLYKGK